MKVNSNQKNRHYKKNQSLMSREENNGKTNIELLCKTNHNKTSKNKSQIKKRNHGA
eukprot:GDKH01016775.1.p2 GENE.GDKH01016775.1~~GDKH01016775.1.p2  ORF type:complete len:56 (+),score=0.97 GDKH01016775.1:63-230(+)